MTGKRFGRVLAIVLALTMLAGMVPAFAAGETAESVYVNGNIYTMDDDNPHATAMAIRGDKLLYVGDKAGAEAYYISGVTKVVDLQGQTVLPGLIEGHMHVPNLGQSMLMIDAFWKPKEVILQAVKEAAESAGPQNMQLSMFQLDDPVLVQIRDQIKGLDINSLTPIEALNKLNEIKKITGI